MEKLNIVMDDDNNSSRRQAVIDGLDNYNFERVEEYNRSVLNLFAYRDNRLAGGLLGGTYWRWLNIDVLWINSEFRGQGIGSALLKQAEDEAVTRGCICAHLDSHDFQGYTFYLRKGYVVAGQLEDLPRGHTRYLLYKQL